jgi:hypothetical protein
MRAKQYLKALKRCHYGGGLLLTFPFDVSLIIEVSDWMRLVAEMNMLTYYDTFSSWFVEPRISRILLSTRQRNKTLL